jgi:hypothetical protein
MGGGGIVWGVPLVGGGLLVVVVSADAAGALGDAFKTAFG